MKLKCFFKNKVKTLDSHNNDSKPHQSNRKLRFIHRQQLKTANFYVELWQETFADARELFLYINELLRSIVPGNRKKNEVFSLE